MHTCTRLVAAVCAAISGLSVAHGATVTLSSLGSSTYSENFDSLANTGTTNSLASGLPGWLFSNTGSVAATTYTGGTGSSATGSFYSFGSSGSTERAFGSVASGGTAAGDFSYGFSLAVGTGSTTLQSLTLSYTGEQWRNGVNVNIQSLTFAYSLDATSLNTGTWTTVSDLTFNSPTHTDGAGALDGNYNSANLSYLFSSLNLAAGQTIYFRWTDIDDSGSDHGLAIDSLNVAATFVPSAPAVPMPTAAMAGSVLMAGLVGLRLSRERRAVCC